MPALLDNLINRCRRSWRFGQLIWEEAPMAVITAAAVLTSMLLFAALFTWTVARWIGYRLAVLVDLLVLLALARLVATAIVFPGSLKLFQRNIEASFRVEVARQYSHYLRQLLAFLRHASGISTSLRGVSQEGVSRGCSVVETLAESMRLQLQSGEVSLSPEQLLVYKVAMDLDQWLASVSVRTGQVDAASSMLLLTWMKSRHIDPPLFGSQVQDLRIEASSGDEVLRENLRQVQQVEVLLLLMEGLRVRKSSWLQNISRFMRSPTVGSIGHLRAEMLLRYKGSCQCWVPRGAGGGRLDAFLLPSPLRLAGEGEDEATSVFSGPIVLCCAPNAAYYEQTLYQSSWIDFWHGHGFSMFLFNYSGYGRSSGSPTPANIARDGDCVIEFLKKQGCNDIILYGRSIGGVPVCHLASRHPAVVRLLVVDRSMSSLQAAAASLYGGLAAGGLRLSRLGDCQNLDNYLSARCPKVMLCDPKDAMIVDLAALRSGVSRRCLESLELPLAGDQAGCTRSWKSDEKQAELNVQMLRCVQAYLRLETIFDACTGARRKARSSGSASTSLEKAVVPLTLTWLEDQQGVVADAMSPFMCQVQSAVEIVAAGLEGAGVRLGDVMHDHDESRVEALKVMIENLLVWGAVEDACGLSSAQGVTNGDEHLADENHADIKPDKVLVSDRDIGLFLGNPCYLARSPDKLARIQAALTPERLSSYHRGLARKRLQHMQQELQTATDAFAREAHGHLLVGGTDGASSSQAESPLRLFKDAADAVIAAAQDPILCRRLVVVRTALWCLEELIDFVHTVEGWLLEVDNASDVAAADDGRESNEACGTPRWRPAAGYCIHIDCGHNGALQEVDLRQLKMHIKAAGL
eukprot:TRINITY_DN32831_c0_g1_i1.p1 TRINITY_DN32831_c0_g1~~TRINITY_DN32831_c0_g1_i1.p1  ORF type:complete len:862 (+),score=176.73 TRINITY_DN32831_c0_g1_i1:100-2685(+)